MKKGEVLRAFYDTHKASGPPDGSWAYIDEWGLAFAEALGVSVEPDDPPPLPGRLCWVPEVAVPLSGYGEAKRITDREGSVVAMIWTTKACPGLGKALVDAYNSQPLWRTGEPPSNGFYLALCAASSSGQPRYLVAYYGGSVTAGRARWTTANGGVDPRFPVTHWMPLPASPEGRK